MPDGSYSGFDTLKREDSFRNPPQKGHSVPILNEFVTPHIESFNALFDDSGLSAGDGDGRGLLSLALEDIDPRVVFDYTGPADADGNPGLGNRMTSMYYFKRVLVVLIFYNNKIQCGFNKCLSHDLRCQTNKRDRLINWRKNSCILQR